MKLKLKFRWPEHLFDISIWAMVPPALLGAYGGFARASTETFPGNDVAWFCIGFGFLLAALAALAAPFITTE